MGGGARLARMRAPVLIAALILGANSTARAAARQDDDLASRFMTAPEVVSDQRLLVEVKVNGVASGTLPILVSKGRITLPAATVRELGIAGRPGQALALSPESGITARLDEATGTLALTVPVGRLATRRFAPEGGAAAVRLSPETWGAYVNYDLNARHALGQASNGAPLGSGSGGFGWGGIAELRVLAPDVVGGFGWAYDSAAGATNAVVRLDSTFTWRPAWLSAAVSAGDVVSTTSALLARSYRFGGLQIGTDHSGAPGWSSSPVASVAGTAQAQSAIDVYLNGQRTFHTNTAGGDFSLVLPPGSTGGGANLVVTDVTGRSEIIPIEVARVDAQLLRQGVFLWSAGLGAPRFNYGSPTTSYDGAPYAYTNASYGALNAVTTTLHTEGGPGLAEAEGLADIAFAPWLATHVSAAASHSDRGTGGAGRLAVTIAGPWNLGLDAAAAHTLGAFDDVVSVSGRAYARAHRIDPILSMPVVSEWSGRLSWQPGKRLSFSASYQANTYQGSAPVGFASIGANYLVGDRIPVFANLSRTMGGERATTLVVGVSFAVGGVQASASGGYATGSSGGAGDQGGYTGSFSASKPLGQGVGDIGWDAYATRAPTGTFANADAQVRTGYGIPGVAVQTLGNQVTGYATLRGSAGVVGMHPFLSDPASGGIIIADAGQSGVPVQLNGYDQGRTSFDGKMAVSGAVAGVPQRLAIDTERLPIDAVPGETDRLVTIRDGGASVAAFDVRSAASSALMTIAFHGQPPPVGSTLVSAASSVPISKAGRAYLPALGPNEVLTVEMPDGMKCLVHTHFDGKGGVGRRLGTMPCEEVH